MDEFDLVLMNAMQLQPRASWAELAGPLGVDSATLSRRWSHLTQTGEAWVTCHLGDNQSPYGYHALVEVGCAAGRVREVARQIVAHPHALSIDLCAGSTDLLLTVVATNSTALSRYVGERVGAIPGVESTRTQVVTRSDRKGTDWRLGSLDSSQRSVLATSRGLARPTRQIPEASRPLVIELARDGRMPIAELSTRTGLPASTVRRRVHDLLASRSIVLRCDFAHTMAGWHLPAFVWMSVPPTEIQPLIARIRAMPQTRALWVTSGPANVCWCAWLHSRADLEPLTTEGLAGATGVRLHETMPVLRAFKRIGHVLDEAGRSVDYMPTDVWSDPLG